VTRPKPIALVGLAVAVAATVWLLFAGASRFGDPRLPGQTGAEPQPLGPERRINVTLFFISEDGLALIGAQREVPFGEAVSDQARRIVEAQLGASPAPLASAIPEGTTLRSVFISANGEAYVDLSGDVTARHTGGALDELFTVYAVVNALTVNLPAVTRVQILIDGKEVDTLAGHVDLRHPLQKSMNWVRTDKDAS
jgi:spore germination protein GerM